MYTACVDRHNQRRHDGRCKDWESACVNVQQVFKGCVESLDLCLGGIFDNALMVRRSPDGRFDCACAVNAASV
jgi:hypothetical protein